MTVTVPDGALPGHKLNFNAPNGQELRVTVPEGALAGHVMTIKQEPATQSWTCVPGPVGGPIAGLSGGQ